MIGGLGVDIVPVERFVVEGNRPGFLNEILTDEELRRVPPGDGRFAFCALVFATKEAVLKALGCGLGAGFRWHDITVTEGPGVQLAGRIGRIAESLSVSKIYVSHSKSTTHAVAVVLIETTKPEVTP